MHNRLDPLNMPIMERHTHMCCLIMVREGIVMEEVAPTSIEKGSRLNMPTMGNYIGMYFQMTGKEPIDIKEHTTMLLRTLEGLTLIRLK